jgi:hypothetical protein
MLRFARHFGVLLSLGVGALGACSVDTSDIKFRDNSLFDNNGAVGNGGGDDSGSGSDSGGASSKSGSGSGGSDGGSKQTGGSKTGGSGGMTSAGMGGSGGMGGMMPTNCMPGVADPLRPEIDNLEDGDPGILPNAGRRGGWYVYNDGTGSQMPAPVPGMPPLHELGGAAGTSYAIHTRGGPFTIFGAGLGIVPNGVPDKPPCAYDVRPQDGLRFWARGMNANMLLRVSLPTVATQAPMQGGSCMEMMQGVTTCGDHYGLDFPLTSNWQQVEISWDELAQNGWGQVRPLDLEHVVNIEFTVVRNVEFDFWIDQVTFY